MTTQAVSTYVETLADQTLDLYRQQQQRAQRRQEEETGRKDQQGVAVLRALIETELESKVLVELGLRYEAQHRDRNGGPHFEAVFSYAGLDWHLSQEEGRGSWMWSIRTTNQGSNYSPSHNLTANPEPTHLQTTLLLKLGECREQVRREAQEAAERERKQQQAAAAAQLREEQAAQKTAARIAQADEEHARLTEQFNARKQQVLSTLWRWPAGRSVRIYQLSYCAGIGQGEEGGAVIEQEGGWTATDQLDAEGYIRIEPANSSFWRSTSKPQEIKLNPAIHLPTWKRVTVASVGELPEALREKIVVSLPGVVLRRCKDLDEEPRLTHVDEQELRYSDVDAFQETVGYVPLPWICALVDAQAAEGSI